MKRARLHKCKAEDAMRSIGSNTVDLVLADPPYDINVSNVAWDRVSNYMGFARAWLKEAVRVLRPGGALMVYGSPCRVWVDRMTILLVDELKMTHVQDMPWVYTQGGDARMENMREYAVRHERLVWFEKPTKGGKGFTRTFNAQEAAEHYSDDDRAVALAKGKGRVTSESLDRGRPPRTFIDIPRENSKSKERKYGKHPSMKPLSLCERLIRVHSKENDLVLVPFAGSGSELLTASKLGRRAIGFEIEDDYIELMQKRFDGHNAPLSFHDGVEQEEAKEESTVSAPPPEF